MKQLTDYITIALLCTASMALTGAARADVLEISVSRQSPELQATVRPQTGMKKEDVERVFGAPQQISGPVGEPPISTWVYADYTVYFEYDRVIHSVLRHIQAQDQ